MSRRLSANRDHRASRAPGPGSQRSRRTLAGACAGALIIALSLAGCGSSPRPAADHLSLNDPHATVSSSERAQERAIHQQVLTSLHQADRSTDRYGGIPRFIPRQKLPDDRVLTATSARPALAVQGDGVELDAPGGSALATAVGPDVPNRIQGSAALHTPAVWDLTFAKVHGAVPILKGMFLITDEQGQTLHPRITVIGGGPLPRTVPAGKPLTLQLSTVVSVGDGKLLYTPQGHHYLAAWDFSVETD